MRWACCSLIGILRLEVKVIKCGMSYCFVSNSSNETIAVPVSLLVISGINWEQSCTMTFADNSKNDLWFIVFLKFSACFFNLGKFKPEHPFKLRFANAIAVHNNT